MPLCSLPGTWCMPRDNSHHRLPMERRPGAAMAFFWIKISSIGQSCQRVQRVQRGLSCLHFSLIHRQLDASGKATLSELVSAGISPRDVQTLLREQDPDSLATRKDIYNRVAELKDDIHEGQNSIHALINQLDREEFWSRVRIDENQRVTAILVAHPGSIQCLQAYSDLLLLDFTYKTNKYQMPLLDMRKITSGPWSDLNLFMNSATPSSHPWS
ncbi:hypothetical protein HZ326_25132 [Fusarium oxysporum f. sp. albedinis]|nr:hypothetical protein HZ326_25132 [Fusarium oxysporum f. sp. albedinis]